MYKQIIFILALSLFAGNAMADCDLDYMARKAAVDFAKRYSTEITPRTADDAQVDETGLGDIGAVVIVYGRNGRSRDYLVSYDINMCLITGVKAL